MNVELFFLFQPQDRQTELGGIQRTKVGICNVSWFLMWTWDDERSDFFPPRFPQLNLQLHFFFFLLSNQIVQWSLNVTLHFCLGFGAQLIMYCHLLVDTGTEQRTHQTVTCKTFSNMQMCCSNCKTVTKRHLIGSGLLTFFFKHIKKKRDIFLNMAYRYTNIFLLNGIFFW